MAEIKCPHCGSVFQVDESEYAQIVRQVRNAEFGKELHARLEEQAKRSAVEAQLEQASKDQRILELEGALAREQASSKHALELARADKEQLEARHAQQLQEQLVHKDQEAREQLARKDQEAREQLERKEQETRDLLVRKEQDIADLHEELERVKNQRSRLNTKLLGESLEQHCEIEFNRIRATAFPRASFEKDTQAVSEGADDPATKGDYIFRECAEDGTEIVSIMFEMKTEQEDATHHKTNEAHLRKLDGDRRKKNCEYAVLVSTLEPESELYNDGIVDVSYLYDKMYVVRPQFFLAIIGLLRNAGRSALEYRSQLTVLRKQDVDVANFEASVDKFKEDVSKNHRTASSKFNAAIDEIDKTISHLQKVRDNLVSSERQLRLINDKTQALSIRKLTKDAPSVRARFEAASAAVVESEVSNEEGLDPDSVENPQ